MKIFYKRTFFSGLGSLLLGLALPVTNLLRGWSGLELKEWVLSVLLILIGISGIARSMNREKAREDRDEDRDERNHWIRIHSQTVGYRVMLWVSAAELICCILGHALTQQEIYMNMAIPCIFTLAAAGIARLVSALYYERKG